MILFDEILGDAGGHGTAREFLTAFAGKENEWECGRLRTNEFEKGHPVRIGKVVVADDTVDPIER